MSGLERDSNSTSYGMTKEIKVQLVSNLAKLGKNIDKTDYKQTLGL